MSRRGRFCTLALCAALVVGSAWPAPAGAVTRPRYGGVLTLAWPGADDELDPAEARSPHALAVASALHAGLFRYDAQGVARPHLIDGPPVPLAGGRLRCRLRRPLTFHDGKTITAADVRASIERLGRGRGPLAWLPEVLTVRIVDRRTFDLVPATGLQTDDVAALLALPQAAVVPRGKGTRGRVGVGPFRLVDGPVATARENLAFVLDAWEEAPRGRTFLDRLRFVRAAAGAEEVEAFHYGQLDVSFSDGPRLRDRPRLDGPPVESLVAVFSAPWSGAGSRDERRGLAALVGPDRGELVRHFDWPAERATRWRPSGGPPAVTPDGRADDWSGEPVTIVHSASDPSLDDVAAALRDLLTPHGMAQAASAPERELPPACRGRGCARHDLHVTTLPWPPLGRGPTLVWAAAWLGLDRAALPRGGARDALRRSGVSWRRFADGGWAVPLLHFRRLIRHGPGLVGARFAPWGGLVLEDAWLSRPVRTGARGGNTGPEGLPLAAGGEAR